MPNLCIIPARALADPQMTRNEMRALLAIGTFTHRDGTGVWAANATLADVAGLDVRHYRRAVSALIARGYVRKIHRWKSDGSQDTSLLAIILDDPAEGGGQNLPRGAESAPRVGATAAQGVGAESAHQTTHQNDPLNDPNKTICSEPQKNAASEPVFSIPCKGAGVKIFHVTQTHIDQWAEAFPAVDIPGDIRRAIVWLDANPKKRKTHGGMKKFLTDWFGRTQDRGGSARAGPHTGPHGTKSPPHRAKADAQWIEDYNANYGQKGNSHGAATKTARDGEADVFSMQPGV